MLYKNSFDEAQHSELSKRIINYEGRWIVTYDICPLVTELYSDYRYGYLDVTYSIRSNRKAKEYIFFSDNLTFPQSIPVQASKNLNQLKC